MRHLYREPEIFGACSVSLPLSSEIAAFVV